MHKIAVVILNYNGSTYLQQFLPLLTEKSPSTSRYQVEIYVIDNASTDSSLEILKNFPLVKVIALPHNKGYAGGYNEGLKHVEADIYAIVNSDIEVTENWIEPCYDFLLSQPSAAACQPKILGYHNRNVFEYAGGAGGYLDWMGYPFCRGRLFDTLEEDKGQYDTTTEVFWASGACFFIKAQAFHEVGGFDTDFFAHMEEIDLCWRLKKNGWHIYCVPASVVHHVGGGTLAYLSPQKTFLNFRNGLYMLVKNYPFPAVTVILLLRLLLDAPAAIYLLHRNGIEHALAILKAHLSFYFALGKLLRKRIKQKTGKYPVIFFPRSIVWAYYIQGKKRYSDLFAGLPH